MFHHILFPVDFSERSKQVAPLVREFAKHYQARLTLLHVIQIPAMSYAGFEAGYPFVFDVEEMKKAAGHELVEFYGPGDDVTPDFATAICQGDPGRLIVEHAAASDVDLIMMPTHGYGPFRRFLLGSVTAKVLHDAHCPVWTAAHGKNNGVARHPESRTMLCAVDRSEKSLPIIRHAVQLAEEFAAQLYLVHAVPFLFEPEGSLTVDQGNYFLNAAKEQIDELQQAAGTKLNVCLAAGDVAQVVSEAALRHSADLVVIGRGRIAERFGGLRTNAYAIIRESPCPVLSV